MGIEQTYTAVDLIVRSVYTRTSSFGQSILTLKY